MTTKKCPMCETILPLDDFSPDKSKKSGYKYICRGCYRIVDKRRYYGNLEKNRKAKNETGKKMAALYPEKWKARYLLRAAVARGIIIKKQCEVCGEKKTQGHHEDYTKPLEVNWLCQIHHAERHKQIKQLGAGV